MIAPLRCRVDALSLAVERFICLKYIYYEALEKVGVKSAQAHNVRLEKRNL